MEPREQKRLVNRAVKIAGDKFDQWNLDRYTIMQTSSKLTEAEIEDLKTYIEEDYYERSSTPLTAFA